MTVGKDFELAKHQQQLVDTVASTRRALAEAEERGDLSNWLKALETSLKVSDYAGRELVRSRLRRHLLEAAEVLSGTYDDLDEVELGDWANGATEQNLHQHAAEFLTLHKSVFS